MSSLTKHLNDPSVCPSVALYKATQLREDFQTLESDFRILQGAFDNEDFRYITAYKSFGLENGLPFTEADDDALELVESVQARENGPSNLPLHQGVIVGEHVVHDRLSKLFEKTKGNLEALRIQFEGPYYYEYPTKSKFQVIGNQPQPMENRKWKKANITRGSETLKGSPKKSLTPFLDNGLAAATATVQSINTTPLRLPNAASKISNKKVNDRNGVRFFMASISPQEIWKLRYGVRDSGFQLNT